MGIRANTGIATIDVNENGDTITFSLADNDFIKKFFDFIEWFQKTGEEITESEKTAEKDLEQSFLSVFKKQKELSDEALNTLEDMFGSGTCKKIFGEISPTYVCVVDIIAQLSEETRKLVEKHNNDIFTKYNRNRKGARSGKK